MDKTCPCQPTFCFLYWRNTKGHQDITWEGSVKVYITCIIPAPSTLDFLGPECMRKISETSTTVNLLKEVALSQNFDDFKSQYTAA